MTSNDPTPQPNLPTAPIPDASTTAVPPALPWNPDDPIARIEGETLKAWESFIAYYGLGPRRSLDKLDDHLNRSPRSKAQIELWSQRHHWQARILAQVDIDRRRLSDRIVEERIHALDRVQDTILFAIDQAKVEWEKSKKPFSSVTFDRRRDLDSAQADLFGEIDAEGNPVEPEKQTPTDENARRDKPIMERVTTRQEQRTGNARYLEVMLAAAKSLSSLFGLDAPSRSENTHELGDKAIEALREQRDGIRDQFAMRLASTLSQDQLKALAAEAGLDSNQSPRAELPLEGGRS